MRLHGTPASSMSRSASSAVCCLKNASIASSNTTPASLPNEITGVPSGNSSLPYSSPNSGNAARTTPGPRMSV